MDIGTRMVRRMEWRKIIIECLQSGQPKSEWCKARGISTRKFYYWQKIIREEELAIIGQANLPNMFPAVVPNNSSEIGNDDFYEVPATISGQMINTPALPDRESVKSKNTVSFQYKGCDLEINTNNLSEALESIIKVINHA